MTTPGTTALDDLAEALRIGASGCPREEAAIELLIAGAPQVWRHPEFAQGVQLEALDDGGREITGAHVDWVQALGAGHDASPAQAAIARIAGEIAAGSFGRALDDLDRTTGLFPVLQAISAVLYARP